MGSYYEHAFLWEKGRESSRNHYTLGMEELMCSSGPVFLGVICDSADLGRQIIAWFYEEGLPVLCNYGAGTWLRNSFLRSVGHKTKGQYALFIRKKNKEAVLWRGEKIVCLKCRGGGKILITNEFLSALGSGLIQKSLSKNLSVKDISRRLKEYARRAESRGVTKGMAAVFVRRKKRRFLHERLCGRV